MWNLVSLECVTFTVKFQVYSEMCGTRLKAQNIVLLNKWTEKVFKCVLNLSTTELDLQVNVVVCYCST